MMIVMEMMVILPELVLDDPINNKLKLVETKALYQAGDSPLSM